MTSVCRCRSTPTASRGGFTLIELVVVMAILGMLLALALPRYMNSVDRSREVALKQDLSVMREAIDKFFGDQAKYPDTLEELVTKRYLRRIPEDPITDSAATWVALPPPSSTMPGRVYDVKSGAEGKARDGSSFSEW
jgi:general secretion pathway protein G